MTGGVRKPGGVLVLELKFHIEYGLFVVLNLADLFLTLLFIRRGALEANPAARWVLFTMGKGGFIAYKIVLMFVVIALTEIVARKRPLAARLLIGFGILALASVVILSGINFYHYMQTHGGAV